MPTYSYRCRECGVEFDIQQDFSDDALTECPQCKGALRKLFSAVGVTFQGSGFYRTDSRAESKSAPAKKESKPKKKESKKAAKTT
ncbi:MAG: FmdB family zinc ribbon protein [Aquiluna sp.]